MPGVDFKKEIDFQPDVFDGEDEEEFERIPPELAADADRMKNAYYYSRNLGLPINQAYDLEPQINEQLYGEGTSSSAAWTITHNRILGTQRKSMWQGLKHGYIGMNQLAAKSIGGLGRQLAEVKGIEASIVDPVFRWMFNLPKDIDLDEMLVDLSDGLQKEIKREQKAHPEMGYAIDPEAGYSETLFQMVTRPENMIQGLVETVPLLLEGILGTMVGGPVGAVAAMGAPISGKVYQEARSEGTEVLPAFAQATATGTLEAYIEKWTLGKKLNLGKNFRRLVAEGGTRRVIWEGVKAFFRGTAEEGSQEFNRNFWQWLFTDRSQKWSQGVKESMAMGGPLEAAMSGGFAGAGYIATPVEVREEQRRLDILRKSVRQTRDLTSQQKTEILNEIDKAQGLVPEILFEAKKPAKVVEEAQKEEKRPQSLTEAVEVGAEAIPAIRLRDGTIRTGLHHGEVYNELVQEGKLDPDKLFTEQADDGWFINGEYISTNEITKKIGTEKYQSLPIQEAIAEYKVQPAPAAEAQQAEPPPAEIAEEEETPEEAKEISEKEINKTWDVLIPPGVSITEEGEVKGEKPPGLTKEEIHIVGTELAKTMRYAQAHDQKVGYKKGVAENKIKSKEAIQKIRLAGTMRQQAKLDAVNLIKTYVPKAEQGRYLRRAVMAKTEENVEKLMGQIQEHLAKVEHRDAIREFAKFVKETKAEYRRGKQQFGLLPPVVAEKITNVLDKYDVAELSEEKEETLKSRQEFVQRLSGELADGFENLNPDLDTEAKNFFVIGRARIEELKRLSKTYIGDLTASEIDFLRDSLEHLLALNEAKGDSKYRRRMENLRTDITKSVHDEVLPEKADIVQPGIIKQAFNEESATMETLVGWITGKDNSSTMKLLVNALQEAERVKDGFIRKFVTGFAEKVQRRKVNLDDVKQLDKRITVQLGGKKVEMSYDDLLGLYGLIKGTDNLESLLKTKGLDITTYVPKLKGAYKQVHTYYVGTPTLAELRDIIKLIPDAHKALMDVHFANNRELIRPALNEMSMEHSNYHVAQLENWWHISRVHEWLPEGPKADTSVSIDQQSAFMPRTGGNARIRVEPFTHVVMRNIYESAAYASGLISQESARTLVANKQWRQKVKESGHSKALKAIDTLIRRQQAYVSDQSILDIAATNIIPKATQSLLSLRITGGVVQASSAPASYESIPREFFRATDVPTIQQVKEMVDVYDFLWIRYKGRHFDYATGLAAAQSAFRSLMLDSVPVLEKGLEPYTWGDQIAVYKIYKASQRMVEATTKFKPGSQEYKEAVGERLYEGLAAQGQWSMLHRSKLTSDPSGLARSFTVFMSTKTGQWNVLLRAVDDYRKGRISAPMAAERIGGVLQSNLQVSFSRKILQSIIGVLGASGLALLGFGDLPDEEDLKKEAERLVSKTFTDTVFNMVGLSVPGEIISSLVQTGWSFHKYKWGALEYIRTGNLVTDFSLDMAQLGAEIADFGQYLLLDPGGTWESGPNKGEYRWYTTGQDLMLDIGKLIAYRYGLPFEGPMADFVWPVKRLMKEEPTKKSKGSLNP